MLMFLVVRLMWVLVSVIVGCMFGNWCMKWLSSVFNWLSLNVIGVVMCNMFFGLLFIVMKWLLILLIVLRICLMCVRYSLLIFVSDWWFVLCWSRCVLRCVLSVLISWFVIVVDMCSCVVVWWNLFFFVIVMNVWIDWSWFICLDFFVWMIVCLFVFWCCIVICLYWFG